MSNGLNNIRGSIGNAYSRLFGVDDPNAVAELAPEVLPTTSIWERPEFWGLLGGRLGSCIFAAAAGGAGTFQRGQIESGMSVPSASELLIVERVRLNNASTYSLGVSSVRQAGYIDSSSFNRDTRSFPAGNAAVAVGARFSFLLGGASSGIVHASIVGPADVDIPYVIKPGDSFHIEGGDNQAVSATIFFRIRPMSVAELRLL